MGISSDVRYSYLSASPIPSLPPSLSLPPFFPSSLPPPFFQHCRVHSGFLATYAALQPQLLPGVQALLEQHPQASIWITGKEEGGGRGGREGGVARRVTTILHHPPTSEEGGREKWAGRIAFIHPDIFIACSCPSLPLSPGHSLGAALAVLCMLDLLSLAYPVRQTITFGQPRVGNKEVREGGREGRRMDGNGPARLSIRRTQH